MLKVVFGLARAVKSWTRQSPEKEPSKDSQRMESLFVILIFAGNPQS